MTKWERRELGLGMYSAPRSAWWDEHHPWILCYLSIAFWGTFISYAAGSILPLIILTAFYTLLVALPAMAFSKSRGQGTIPPKPRNAPPLYDPLVAQLDAELLAWEKELEELGRSVLESR